MTATALLSAARAPARRSPALGDELDLFRVCRPARCPVRGRVRDVVRERRSGESRERPQERQSRPGILVLVGDDLREDERGRGQVEPCRPEPGGLPVDEERTLVRHEDVGRVQVEVDDALSLTDDAGSHSRRRRRDPVQRLVEVEQDAHALGDAHVLDVERLEERRAVQALQDQVRALRLDEPGGGEVLGVEVPDELDVVERGVRIVEAAHHLGVVEQVHVRRATARQQVTVVKDRQPLVGGCRGGVVPRPRAGISVHASTVVPGRTSCSGYPRPVRRNLFAGLVVSCSQVFCGEPFLSIQECWAGLSWERPKGGHGTVAHLP